MHRLHGWVARSRSAGRICAAVAAALAIGASAASAARAATDHFAVSQYMPAWIDFPRSNDALEHPRLQPQHRGSTVRLDRCRCHRL